LGTADITVISTVLYNIPIRQHRLHRTDTSSWLPVIDVRGNAKPGQCSAFAPTPADLLQVSVVASKGFVVHVDHDIDPQATLLTKIILVQPLGRLFTDDVSGRTSKPRSL
jgi:hypothetical protein